MVSNRQLFLNSIAQTSYSPLMLEVVKAEGIFLYGPNNEKYIDLISGIAVSTIGHRHPSVVKAIKDQVDSYMHLMVYGEYVQVPQVQLAEKLKSTLPKELDSVYLVNSGAEATEGAIKLAKRYTQRTELISCIGAYHGSTNGALSLMGDDYFKEAYQPLLPGTSHIPFNDLASLNNITAKTAAVFVETIQGEAGVRVPSKEYMIALRNRCTAMGALLVLDEIQTGFGRTGTFWSFEQFGIVPDVVLTSKGMGGGMPIGAFISKKEIMRVLSYNPILGHITTFGGHPVSCAASSATIDVLLQEGLVEQVTRKAELFRMLLIHPSIREIRNFGLLMAVEFDSFEKLKRIIDKAIQLGVITDWFLFCSNSMRIAPPITITDEEIKMVCSVLLEAMDA